MRNPDLTPKLERELQAIRDEQTRQREKTNAEFGLAESLSVHGKPELELRPYLKYRLAVDRLEKLIEELEGDFGTDGYVRTLTAPVDKGGLYNKPMPEGGPRQQAWNALKSLGIREAIPVDKVHLRFAGIDKNVIIVDDESGNKREIAHFMVKLRQVAKLEGRTQPVWYLGGNAAVQVHMDENGVVYKIDATLARGARPRTLHGIISDEETVKIAKDTFGSKCEQIGKVRLRLKKDGHHSDLVKVATFSDRGLRSKGDPECPKDLHARTVTYFINAKTGEIKEQQQKLRYHNPVGPDGRLVEVKTKSFATIPYGRPDKQSPNKEKELYAELEKESFDRTLSNIPRDSKGNLVLENETCKVHYNKTSQSSNRKARAKKLDADKPVWTTKVEPLADGSFNFKPGQEEYDAILLFIAINFEIDYLKARGLKAPKKAIVVFVHDESVRDNAYFDPDKGEIHIGVGSGGNWGLFKKICFDLGVTWHEAGHWVVWLQTPGQDLPGDEGGAMHESTGDVLGDILMDLLYIATYLTKVTGKPFTKDTIRKYHWIIGYYCLAPDGIRNQMEPKKVYPKDMENEVHNDGLISGQACVEILLNMVNASGDDVSALDILDRFARIYLGALAIVPADKVKFVDMLRAMVTADREIFSGSNRAAIEDGWKAHGVTLDTTSRRKLAA